MKRMLTPIIACIMLVGSTWAQDTANYKFAFTATSQAKQNFGDTKPKAGKEQGDINFTFDGKILKGVSAEGDNLITHFISKVVETRQEGEDGEAITRQWALEYTGINGLTKYAVYSEGENTTLWLPTYAKSGLLSYYTIYKK